MKTFYIKNDPVQDIEIIDLRQLIIENSTELKNENSLNQLVEQIGDAKYVLLGEASHGTHEYYVLRAQISKLLIEKKGFSFIFSPKSLNLF